MIHALVIQLRLKGIQCALVCILLVLFSLCIHLSFPFNFIAYSALIIIALIISYHYIELVELFNSLLEDIISKSLVSWNITGLIFGSFAALYYRYTYHTGLMPNSFHSFIIVAILIAITEELLFRGVIQTVLLSNSESSPLLAALAHATYKSAIFIPLVNIHEANIPSLFFWSFLAFTGLGYANKLSKSLAPPVLAHVIFDIIVYADFQRAPWWIW